jgi:hypothetical protein
MKLGQSKGMALQRKFRGKQNKRRDNVARKIGAHIACNRTRIADPVALAICCERFKEFVWKFRYWNVI